MFLHTPQQLLGSLGGMYIWFWRTHNTVRMYFVFGLCIYMCLLNTHRLAACSAVSASGSEAIETCGRVQCVCALCGVTHTVITVLDQCLPRPHHSSFAIHTHCLSHYTHTEKCTHTYMSFLFVCTEIFLIKFFNSFSEHLKQTCLFSPQMNRLQTHRFSGSDRNALSSCILSP